MTFALLTDPETLNRRLAHSVFLVHPADRSYFENLLSRCRSLAEKHKRNIEKYLPDVNQASAWSTAYDIYEAFVELDSQPPSPEAVVRASNRSQIEESWSRYLANYAMFHEYIRRGDVTVTIASYLGMVDDDLSGNPMIQTERGPERRPDWSEVAERVDHALGRWERMGKSEKQSIPQMMAARRIEEANRELATRLSALEARQRQAA